MLVEEEGKGEEGGDWTEEPQNVAEIEFCSRASFANNKIKKKKRDSEELIKKDDEI